MKIVNLDGYTTNPGDLSWDNFHQYGDFTVYERTKPDEIMERAKDADVLIINKSVITVEMLEKLPRLKYVGLQSTGYNVIDGKAARARGITVSNIPAYSTNAVAQLVFSFILQITNQVTLHADAVKDGEWCACPDFCFWKTPLMELEGKTLGIIGFGSIGKRVATLAEAFGMHVMVHTPHPAPAQYPSVTFVSFEELLSKADFITCHCPLTPQTENLIDAKALSVMKPTAMLINTARGPIVDETALAQALNSGKLRAAGMDVLREEPPRKDNPLLHAKNCFITPHIAWAAYETRARLMHILEENLKAFLNGTPQNVVN